MTAHETKDRRVEVAQTAEGRAIIVHQRSKNAEWNPTHNVPLVGDEVAAVAQALTEDEPC